MKFSGKPWLAACLFGLSLVHRVKGQDSEAEGEEYPVNDLVYREQSYDTLRERYAPGEVGDEQLAAHLNGDILEEAPGFALLEQCNGFDIRQYDSGYIASTTRDPNSDVEHRDEDFKKLADYIGVLGEAPKNDRQEEIDMTVPVAYTNDLMWFYLPSEYGDDSSPPKPTDPSVAVTKLEPRIVAAYPFSGHLNPQLSEDNAEKLLSALSESGHDNSWYSLAYNPPWTPPNKRTNEIHVVLENYDSPICPIEANDVEGVDEHFEVDNDEEAENEQYDQQEADREE